MSNKIKVTFVPDNTNKVIVDANKQGVDSAENLQVIDRNHLNITASNQEELNKYLIENKLEKNSSKTLKNQVYMKTSDGKQVMKDFSSEFLSHNDSNLKTFLNNFKTDITINGISGTEFVLTTENIDTSGDRLYVSETEKNKIHEHLNKTELDKFVSGDKGKLDSIETGAQQNIIEKIKVNDGEISIINKVVNINVPSVSDFLTKSHETDPLAHNGLFEQKVDKVEGKGLSTNDYTDKDKEKLSELPIIKSVTVSLQADDWIQTEHGFNLELSPMPVSDTSNLLVSLKIMEGEDVDFLLEERIKIYRISAEENKITFYATGEVLLPLSFDIIILE